MSVHDDDNFDELDAMRRFPPEDQWLDLPMPAELAGSDGSASFADRVLQARHEEQELDERIAELDTELPSELLQQFAAPSPRASFVDDTMESIQRDRQTRWQHLLARYVAPEPSPEFVSRTLTALELDGRRQSSASARSSSTRSESATGGARRQSSARMFSFYGLLAAAAALLLWVVVTDNATRQPLELRLADQTAPSTAHADATSPMGAILAKVNHQDEPFAMFDASADGLWLANDLAGNPFDDGGEIR